MASWTLENNLLFPLWWDSLIPNYILNFILIISRLLTKIKCKFYPVHIDKYSYDSHFKAHYLEQMETITEKS